MRNLVERIMVVDEAGGVREICRWRDVKDARHMRAPGATVDGLEELELDDGEHVAEVQKDVWRDLHGRLYSRI